VVVLPGTLEYEVTPVVEPGEVRVTISERAYNELDPGARRIELDPDEHLRTAERGRLLSVPVPLTPLVSGVNVELNPDYVTLRAMLKERLQEASISAVPIKIEASLDIFNDYNVEVKDAGAILTRPVTIRGPAEMIERIKAGDIRLRGVVSLTAADKADPGRFRYQTPRFILPEGVALVTDPEPIEFRLLEKPPVRSPSS
jgi:hypothetical protein